jgi:hypothetical protein
VKRNPETQEVALRTTFDEALLPQLAWVVSTLTWGARNMRTSDVQEWDDLVVPDPPAGS